LCTYAQNILTQQFDIKFLGPTTFCLGLQVHHVENEGVFLHEEAYVNKILKEFQMDNANPLAVPMFGTARQMKIPTNLVRRRR
jgi:hypothetical protein